MRKHFGHNEEDERVPDAENTALRETNLKLEHHIVKL